jgi:hypothetical protein
MIDNHYNRYHKTIQNLDIIMGLSQIFGSEEATQIDAGTLKRMENIPSIAAAEAVGEHIEIIEGKQ